MTLRLTRGSLVQVLASSFTLELCVGTAVATQWREDGERADYPAIETVSYDLKRTHHHGVELNEDPFVLVEWPPGVTRRRPGYHLLFPPGIVLVTVFALAAVLFILNRRRKLTSGEPNLSEGKTSEDGEGQVIPESHADSETHDSERSRTLQSKLQHVSSQMERLKGTRKYSGDTSAGDSRRDDTQQEEKPVTSVLPEELLDRFTTLAERLGEAVAAALEPLQRSDSDSELVTVLEGMKGAVDKIVDAEVSHRLEHLLSDLRSSAAEGDAGVAEAQSPVNEAGV